MSAKKMTNHEKDFVFERIFGWLDESIIVFVENTSERKLIQCYLTRTRELLNELVDTCNINQDLIQRYDNYVLKIIKTK